MVDSKENYLLDLESERVETVNCQPSCSKGGWVNERDRALFSR